MAPRGRRSGCDARVTKTVWRRPLAAAALLFAACGGEPGAANRAGPPPEGAALQVFPAAAACEAPDSVEPPPPADTVDSRALALAVNIPAYRLDVREGDSVVARYPIAVGLPRHPTPTGEYAIASVEWNPWWIPPESDWARGERRTPPGPSNPLGPVKMEFAPLYLVHGTSSPASIGTAASHGCIRLPSASAVELAERVQRYGAPDSAARLATAAQRGTATRAVRLARAVPLVVRYELVEIVNDSVRGYPDVYRRRSAVLDTAAARMLEQHAALPFPTALALVDRLLAAARDSAATLPLPLVP